MKIDKIILAAALGLGMASACYADDIYLTGSTAMRGDIYNTLKSGAVFTSAPTITTWGNATASKATYMDFVGTLTHGSGITTIHCSWSGSEAGIQNVAGRVSAAFSTDTADGTTHSGNPSGTANNPVDLCMADTSQAFSRTTSPLITGTNVAVITFKWVRNNGIWTGTNVSDQQAYQALTGYAPIGVFTGSTTSDTSSFVYVSGRDDLSGTRVNTYGLTGFGIFNPPNQIELDGAGNMLDLSGNGSGVWEGDFGFSSGGSLAASLAGSTKTTTDQIESVTGFSVIAYLGYDDAGTAISDGCTECSYDGVSYSAGGVQEGQYNFWGNEYLYQAPSADWNSTQVGTLYGDMANQIPNWVYPNNGADPNAISLATMNCKRSGPLAPPGHN